MTESCASLEEEYAWDPAPWDSVQPIGADQMTDQLHILLISSPTHLPLAYGSSYLLYFTEMRRS